MFLGFYKAGIEIKRHPGILLINVAANGVGMVDRQKTPFLEEARAFGQPIGKEQLHLAPVTVRSGDAVRAADDVGHMFPRAVDRGDVQFVVHEHRRHALVGRYALK